MYFAEVRLFQHEPDFFGKISKTVLLPLQSRGIKFLLLKIGEKSEKVWKIAFQMSFLLY